MKTAKFALLVACSVVFAALVACSNQSSKGPVGRFQLVTGQYVLSFNDSTSTVHGLFRIDTATGETKQFLAGTSKDGSTYAIWGPIR